MIKKLSLLFIVSIFTYGCSQFIFVYENYIEDSVLSYKTIIEVSGDDEIIIRSNIKQIIKEPDSESKNEYVLKISSEKKEKNLVIESDQTASQIEVSHKIIYTLKSEIYNCLIDKKEIKTLLDYKVKSAGYNFGSDSSKTEIIRMNIDKNIKIYLRHVENNLQKTKCDNEN